ncbi:hypothetical protein BDD43_1488 [Mucilaginibacter gracilis]|uniref:Uncharacterized protein n=1 Tax=Mucilaginibacter gracilis TaxID=423350 RepID=A0A495IXW7_9SPHI|nr:hypothetical protein [Mucilaginibacter gracilis]RKR81343.1 hypothetical protein BDD43_1488 [Mucilaginibacter gracilis]
MDRENIIYSLTIEDIYTVAEEELNRNLTEEEVLKISHKIGDYIDWHQAILNTINDTIQ